MTENLKKRRLHVSWCVLFKSSGEDVNHQLLDCWIASRFCWETLSCSDGSLKDGREDLGYAMLRS